MPLYHYEALDANGQQVVGSMQVAGEQALRQRLAVMGYQATLVEVSRRDLRAQRPARQAVPTADRAAARVQLPELTVSRFYYQMATLLRAGINPFEALLQMQSTARDRRLHQIVTEMAQGVQNGHALSKEMKRYPRCFFEGDLGLIEAAEVAGCLPQAFQMLADDHEQDDQVRRRLRIWEWLFHGQFLTVLLAIPLAVLLNRAISGFWTAPDMQGYVKDSAWSAVRLGLVIVLVFGGLYGGGLWFIKQARYLPGWRRRWHGWLLRLPIVAPIQRARASAVLTRALQFLHHAGLDNVRAWATAARAVPNLALAEAAVSAEPRVESTGALSAGLTECQLIGPNEISIIAAGERAGQLEGALDKVAGHYEYELKSAIGASTTKGIISIVTWSVILGLLALAIFMAGYSRGLLGLMDNM